MTLTILSGLNKFFIVITLCRVTKNGTRHLRDKNPYAK